MQGYAFADIYISDSHAFTKRSIRSLKNMRSTLRIAILKCDELAGNPKKEHGSIGNFYRKFLEAGAQKLEESGLHKRPNVEYFFYDVVTKQEYPNIREIDAVFVTGSRE